MRPYLAHRLARQVYCPTQCGGFPANRSGRKALTRNAQRPQSSRRRDSAAEEQDITHGSAARRRGEEWEGGFALEEGGRRRKGCRRRVDFRGDSNRGGVLR